MDETIDNVRIMKQNKNIKYKKLTNQQSKNWLNTFKTGN
jgi:hypothetical protein